MSSGMFHELKKGKYFEEIISLKSLKAVKYFKEIKVLKSLQVKTKTYLEPITNLEMLAKKL